MRNSSWFEVYHILCHGTGNLMAWTSETRLPLLNNDVLAHWSGMMNSEVYRAILTVWLTQSILQKQTTFLIALKLPLIANATRCFSFYWRRNWRQRNPPSNSNCTKHIAEHLKRGNSVWWCPKTILIWFIWQLNFKLLFFLIPGFSTIGYAMWHFMCCIQFSSFILKSWSPVNSEKTSSPISEQLQLILLAVM